MFHFTSRLGLRIILLGIGGCETVYAILFFLAESRLKCGVLDEL